MEMKMEEAWREERGEKRREVQREKKRREKIDMGERKEMGWKKRNTR